MNISSVLRLLHENNIRFEKFENVVGRYVCVIRVIWDTIEIIIYQSFDDIWHIHGKCSLDKDKIGKNFQIID